MDWTQIIVTFLIGLPAIVASIGALIASLRNGNKTDDLKNTVVVKSRAVEDKVDENTALTKTASGAAAANAKAAATNASAAASAATAAAEVSKEICAKLNGGVDSAIRLAVDPIKKALEEHTAADDRNVKEVNEKVDKLSEYIHKRNHDIADALQDIVVKQALILNRMGVDPGKK